LPVDFDASLSVSGTVYIPVANNAFQYRETGYKCQQNCNINNIQQNHKKDRKKNECDNVT